MCGQYIVYSNVFRNVHQVTLLTQTRFTMCGTGTLFNNGPRTTPRAIVVQQKERKNMIERGLYYATSEFGEMIRAQGGTWNDTKHRPIVCLVQSKEHEGLFWAIPMGKLNHRDVNQQARLNFFLNLPDRDIRSCYYHVGRTSTKSIFFISDAIPITDKYIDSIHVGGDGLHYIIKNSGLIKELERKLFRVLSVENTSKNYFRQHITDVKNHLLNELSGTSEPKAITEGPLTINNFE